MWNDAAPEAGIKKGPLKSAKEEYLVVTKNKTNMVRVMEPPLWPQNPQLSDGDQ